MRYLTILGATGSIGTQTLELVADYPDDFQIHALVARNNVDLLIKQARKFTPKHVVIGNDDHYDLLRAALAGSDIELHAGDTAIMEIAAHQVDICVAAITGAAGIGPVYHALQAGNDVALANKEALVCAGHLLINLAASTKAKLLPLDSEHNALFQLLEGRKMADVSRLTLTASGGPFRSLPLAKMRSITKAQALNHPNWVMGQKISIDSATMMNKGLELIEAHHLFQLGNDGLDVLVHPQSIVHGIIEMVDGAQMAAFGETTMRGAIAHCLGFPKRLKGAVAPLDLARIGTLAFEAPDAVKFPALALARHALDCGQAACIALNAANEIAVDAFLKDRIEFHHIYHYCAQQVAAATKGSPPIITDIHDVLALDQEYRATTNAFIY